MGRRKRRTAKHSEVCLISFADEHGGKVPQVRCNWYFDCNKKGMIFQRGSIRAPLSSPTAKPIAAPTPLATALQSHTGQR